MSEMSESPNTTEPLLTALVTCYNEQDLVLGSIATVVAALQKVGISYEILVIDDASRDESADRVRRHIADHPELPIRLHINNPNQGFGANYTNGSFLGRGKYYHLICGDDSMPEEHLVNTYRLIGKADMIIPYQIQDEVAGKSVFRRNLSKTFTAIVNLLSGYSIKYYNGMAVHLRYNVMRWHSESCSFGFQADLITKLLDRGASYIQVYSCSIDKKGRGSTSVSMRNLLSVGHTLLEITLRRIRRMLYGTGCPKPVEILVPQNELELTRRHGGTEGEK